MKFLIDYQLIEKNKLQNQVKNKYLFSEIYIWISLIPWSLINVEIKRFVNSLWYFVDQNENKITSDKEYGSQNSIKP